MSKPRRRIVRVLLVLVLVVALVAFGLWWALPGLDDFQVDGTIELPGLDAPVRIVRDERGTAYVYAESRCDALYGQGFATAQSSFFRMQVTKLVVQGRLSELAGDAMIDTDIERRTIGFHRLAKAHEARLDDRSRAFLQCYADGVDAFVTERSDEWPLGLEVGGVAPEPWTPVDSLSIFYYFGWNSAANLRHELVAQTLVDRLGEEAARTLFPINVNPDSPADTDLAGELGAVADLDRFGDPFGDRLGDLLDDPRLRALLDVPADRFGSNNWVVGAAMSPGGKPILAGDPHLDPRLLPGVWHPIGLILPDRRVVGATVPGIPGVGIGRNDFVAWSMTNAYADTQDLFVETVDPADPGRYLEPSKGDDAGDGDGGDTVSVPFEVVRETLRVRDEAAPGGLREETIEIRRTRRGPVVSGVLSGVDAPGGERVVTLGWSAAHAMGPRLGLGDVFDVRSADDLDRYLQDLSVISLNFVFADVDGHLGWRVTGAVPERANGAGVLPWDVQRGEAWRGWIAPGEMPHDFDPARGWLGTANHYTVVPERGYFTNLASPSYRYRRMIEVLDGAARDGATVSVDDHWRLQRDATNLMARSLAPVLAAHLEAHEATADLGRLLAAWDHVDAPDRPEPLLFQDVYRRLAFETFRDELGDEAATAFLANWYFWQERFERMVLAGESGQGASWFDDIRTGEAETLDDLIQRAAAASRADLAARFGPDPSAWRWGNVHHLTFRDPVANQDDFLGDLLGSGPHPVGGSGETLLRGWYDYDDPYAVTHTASLRMVVDLADDEKIRAVLPGGTVARLFHPHRDDQIEPFLSGAVVHWWWSDAAIAEHAVGTLTLRPAL